MCLTNLLELYIMLLKEKIFIIIIRAIYIVNNKKILII